MIDKLKFVLFAAISCILLVIFLPNASALVYQSTDINDAQYSGNFIQVNENRLSRVEVNRFLKKQQLAIVLLLDDFYKLRNEMNRLVEPPSLNKPPKPIVNRVAYKDLLTEQLTIKQKVINIYYEMERQIYEWESLTLINESIRSRAEQDMHYYRDFLYRLFEADDDYLTNFEKLVLFYETDFNAYFIIDNKLHFAREESLHYFEGLQEKLIDSTHKQKHFIFVLKEKVRHK